MANLRVVFNDQGPAITLTHPAMIQSGASFSVTLSAEPAADVTSLRLLRDGEEVGVGTSGEPFSVDLQHLGSGKAVRLLAIAVDRYGNRAEQVGTVDIAYPHYIHGKVLNDHTSYPLAGVSLRVTTPLATLDLITDEMGFYEAYAYGYPVQVTVTDSRFAALNRHMSSVRDSWRVPDLRLRNRGPSQAAAGASFISGDQSIGLDSQYGGTASATAYGTQGIPELLPLGYAPVRGFELVGATGSGTLSWSVADDRLLPVGETLLVLQREGNGWRVLQRHTIGSGAFAITIPNATAGKYLAVMPDTWAQASAVSVGDTLIREQDQMVPPSALAESRSIPAKVSVYDDPTTEFRLRLQTRGSLQSGSQAQIVASELHQRFNGNLALPDYTLDLFVYSFDFGTQNTADNLGGGLAVRSRADISADLTRRAEIRFTGQAGTGDLARIARGQVWNLGSVSIDTTDAADGPRATRFTNETNGNLPNVHRGSVLAGFRMEIGGSLDRAPMLQLPASDHQAVVLVVSRDGGKRWYYAGQLNRDGTHWVNGDSALDLLRSGSYAIVALDDAITEISGQVLDGSTPLAEANVIATAHPFLGLSGADGNYRTYLPQSPASQVLTAVQPVLRRNGVHTVPITSGLDQLASQDIAVFPGTFSLTASQPYDGSANLDLLPELILDFDQPVTDDQGLLASAITLAEDGGAVVPLQLQIEPGRLRVRALPTQRLAHETHYVLTISDTLVSLFGDLLDRTETIAFRTRAAEPSRVLDLTRFILSYEAGQLYLTAPTVAFAPGTQLRIFNPERAFAASLDLADTPLRYALDGAPGEAIQLEAITPDGEVVSHTVDFTQTAEDTFIIGNEPFSVEVAEGLVFAVDEVEGGAGTEIRLYPMTEAQVRADLALDPSFRADPELLEQIMMFKPMRIEPVDPTARYGFSGRLIIQLDPEEIPDSTLALVDYRQRRLPVAPDQLDTFDVFTQVNYQDAFQVEGGEFTTKTNARSKASIRNRGLFYDVVEVPFKLLGYLGMVLSPITFLVQETFTSLVTFAIPKTVKPYFLMVHVARENSEFIEPPPFKPDEWHSILENATPLPGAYVFHTVSGPSGLRYDPLGITDQTGDVFTVVYGPPGSMQVIDPLTNQIGIDPSPLSYTTADPITGVSFFEFYDYLVTLDPNLFLTNAGEPPSVSMRLDVGQVFPDNFFIDETATEELRDRQLVQADSQLGLRVTVTSSAPIAAEPAPEISFSGGVQPTSTTLGDNEMTFLFANGVLADGGAVKIRARVFNDEGLEATVEEQFLIIDGTQQVSLDGVTPFVLEVKPNDGAENIGVNEPIQVTFSEQVRDINSSTVQLIEYENGTEVGPVPLVFLNQNGTEIISNNYWATKLRLVPQRALRLSSLADGQLLQVSYAIRVENVRDADGLMEQPFSSVFFTAPFVEFPGDLGGEGARYTRITGVNNLVMLLQLSPGTVTGYTAIKLKLFDMRDPLNPVQVWERPIFYHNLIRAEIQVFLPEDLDGSKQVVYGPEPNQAPLDDLPPGTIVVIGASREIADDTHEILLLEYVEKDGLRGFDSPLVVPIGTLGYTYSSAKIGQHFLLGMVDFDSDRERLRVYDVPDLVRDMGVLEKALREQRIPEAEYFARASSVGQVAAYLLPGDITQITPFIRQEIEDGASSLKTGFLASGLGRPSINNFDLSEQPPIIGLTAESPHPNYDGRELAKISYTEPGTNGVRSNAAAERFSYREGNSGEFRVRDLALFGDVQANRGDLLIFEVPRERDDLSGDSLLPIRVIEFERGLRSMSFDDRTGLLAIATFDNRFAVLDLKNLLETPSSSGDIFDDRGYDHPAFVTPVIERSVRSLHFINGNLYVLGHGGEVKFFPVAPATYRERGWVYYDLNGWMIDDGAADTARLDLASDMSFFAADIPAPPGKRFVMELGTYAIDLFEQENITVTLQDLSDGTVLDVIERENGFGLKRENFSLHALADHFQDTAVQKELREQGYRPLRLSFRIEKNGVLIEEGQVNFLVFYQTPNTESFDVARFHDKLDLLALQPHLEEKDQNSSETDHRLSQSFGRSYRADTAFQPGLYGVGMLSTQQLHVAMPLFWDVAALPASTHLGGFSQPHLILEQPGAFLLHAEPRDDRHSVRMDGELDSEFLITSDGWELVHQRSMSYNLATDEPLPDFTALFNALNGNTTASPDALIYPVVRHRGRVPGQMPSLYAPALVKQQKDLRFGNELRFQNNSGQSSTTPRKIREFVNDLGGAREAVLEYAGARTWRNVEKHQSVDGMHAIYVYDNEGYLTQIQYRGDETRVRSFTWEALPEAYQGQNFVYKRLARIEQGHFYSAFSYNDPASLKVSRVESGFGLKTLSVTLNPEGLPARVVVPGLGGVEDYTATFAEVDGLHLSSGQGWGSPQYGITWERKTNADHQAWYVIADAFQERRFQYDNRGRLARIEQMGGGKSWSFPGDFGPFSRAPNSYTDPLDRTYQLTVTQAGVRRERNGLSMTDHYATSGIIVGQTEPDGFDLGTKQSRFYAPAGNGWESRNGRSTKIPYHGTNYIQQEYTYNPFGEPVVSVVNGVREEVVSRDGNGLPRDVVTMGGLRQRIDYFFSANKYIKVESYQGLSRRTETHHDEKLRVTASITTVDGITTTNEYRYDRLDRMVEVKRNGKTIWQATYRGDSEMPAVITTDEEVTTYHFASDNFQPIVTGATIRDLQTNQTRDMVLETDAGSRLIREERSGTGPVRYTYDSFNRLIRITADDCGEVLREITYDGRDTIVEDFAWNRTEITTREDASGFQFRKKITALYRPVFDCEYKITPRENDGKGYLFARERTGSGYPLTEIHDLAGELIGIEVDGHVVEPDTFDAWGNPTNLTGLEEPVTFGYTEDGTIQGASGFGNPVEFTIEDGRMTGGTNPRGQSFQIDFQNDSDLDLDSLVVDGVPVISRQTSKNKNGSAENYLLAINPERGFTKQVSISELDGGDSADVERVPGSPVTAEVNLDPASGLIIAATDEQGDAYQMPRDCFGRVSGLVIIDGIEYNAVWDNAANRLCYTPTGDIGDPYCTVFDGYGLLFAHEGAIRTEVARDELGRIISRQIGADRVDYIYEGSRLKEIQGEARIVFSNFTPTGDPRQAQVSGPSEATIRFDKWSPFAGPREIEVVEGSETTTILVDDFGDFRGIAAVDGSRMEVKRTGWGNISNFIFDGATYAGNAAEAVFALPGDQMIDFDPEDRLEAFGSLVSIDGGPPIETAERFEYGPDGRLVAHYRDSDPIATFIYERDRLQVIYPREDRAVDYRFDGDGTLTETVETRNLSTNPVTRRLMVLERDPKQPDRIRTMIDANGVRATYRYSPAGNVTAIDIENGPTFIYGYDSSGRVTHVEVAGMRVDYQNYNGAFPETITWGNGEQFAVTAEAGRLTAIQGVDLELNLDWFTGYDTDGDGEVDDPRPPRVARLTRTGPGFGETIDLLTGEYDRLLESAVITRSTGQVIEEDYGITDEGLLAGWVRRVDGVTVIDRTHGLSPLRIESEASGAGSARDLLYDAEGNLRRIDDPDGQAVALDLTFNSERQLTELQRGLAATGEHRRFHYEYDNRNLRMAAQDAFDPISRIYFYHEGQVIAIGSKLGESITWTHAIGRIDENVAFVKDLTGAGHDYYVFSDHLGTPFAWRNAIDNSVTYTPFSPWGELLAEVPARGPPYPSGTVPTDGFQLPADAVFGIPPIGLGSHLYETDTGLVYMGARYYEPRLGQFLNRDLRLPDLSDPTSITEPYAYASGNPTLFKDPDGRKPKRPKTKLNATTKILRGIKGQPGTDILQLDRPFAPAKPGTFVSLTGGQQIKKQAAKRTFPETHGSRATPLKVESHGQRTAFGDGDFGKPQWETGRKPRKTDLTDHYGHGATSKRNPRSDASVKLGDDLNPGPKKGILTEFQKKYDAEMARESRAKWQLDASATAGCFVAGTPVLSANGRVPIESVQVGDRVLTSTSHDASLSGETRVDPATWKRISLELPQTDGVLYLSLLRPPKWLAATDTALGALIQLNLAEIGISGQARVTGIEPCPIPEAGPGRVVLGTLSRQAENLLEISLADGTAFEVTDNHRFFSADRQAWIPAAELGQYEQLITRDGMVRIDDIEPVPGRQVVFNLEVEADQEFFATDSDVLTHNTSSAPHGLVDGNVPTNHGGGFASWFNSLTPKELQALWNNNTYMIGTRKIRDVIKDRIRSPGGLHEWLMVSRANKFKEWHVSMDAIKGLTQETKKVFLKLGNERGKHGKKLSGRMHNELGHLIDTSRHFSDYVDRMQDFARRWLPNGVADLPPGLQLK